jgi:hypothetical protein
MRQAIVHPGDHLGVDRGAVRSPKPANSAHVL